MDHQQQQQWGSSLHEMSATPVPGGPSFPVPGPEVLTTPPDRPDMITPKESARFPSRDTQEQEIRRLEEEEHELNIAIAENERLQRLGKTGNQSGGGSKTPRSSSYWPTTP